MATGDGTGMEECDCNGANCAEWRSLSPLSVPPRKGILGWKGPGLMHQLMLSMSGKDATKVGRLYPVVRPLRGSVLFCTVASTGNGALSTGAVR